MRQAGVLAAAGIVALETMVSRLGEDQARARKLADGLRKIRGVVLDNGSPATNMVFLSLADSVASSAQDVAEKLKQRGVLVGAVSERCFRLVLHCWVDDVGVDRALTAFEEVLA